MNGQRYAIEIEHIIRNVFSCERFGFGGVVDSDFIRTQPFIAIIAALAYRYATADKKLRGEIERFIEKNFSYLDSSIDEFFSSERPEKITDGIRFPNGEEALEKIIKDFSNLVKKSI